MTGADATPSPPPEGILLKRARESWRPRKLSMRQAADKAGVSETTWRHAEGGYEVKGGVRFPYRVGDSTLARMALTVGIDPERMGATGREDAAVVMRDIVASGAREPELVATCRYETEILRTPGVTMEVKRLLIEGHRQNGHSSWCGEYGENAPERRSALSAAV